jgi:predicted ArsR family transcriptional regulator
MEAMQPTRRRILELLREGRACTADDMAAALRITSVTVRHHLEVLKADDLVEMVEVRHRETPGRPQHTYRLTAGAFDQFPKNYQALSMLMLDEIKDALPAEDMERLTRGMATRMAAQAHMPPPEAPADERMNAAVRYLNQCGYSAEWEREPGPDAGDRTFVLRTRNCPYHGASHRHQDLCDMDRNLVADLLGVMPAVRDRITLGTTACSYVIKL